MKSKLIPILMLCACSSLWASKAARGNDQNSLGHWLQAVEQAAVEGDKAGLQMNLQRVSEINSTLPAWTLSAFEMAVATDAGESERLAAWQALNLEAQELMSAGDYEQAGQVMENALLLASETFGAGHWLTIAATRDLGFVARQLGDAETADALYNRAYALSIEVLGQSHPRTQEIAELMAELFAAAGAFEEALTFRELITSAYEDALGPRHELTLTSLVNQASTYEAAGDFASATGLLEVACGAFEGSYSRYHALSVDCWSYLAGLHRAAGSLDESEKIRQMINASLVTSTEGISELALANLMQLADIYYERGEYQQGRELLSGLILTARQINAIDLSYTGKAYLARTLTAEGTLAGAQALNEDVVAYGATAWANRPLQYYNALLQLGAVYQRQSRLDDAESIFADSVTALLEIVGDRHPTTLVAMNNLGSLYEQIGLYDEAEPLLKQTLEGMEQVMGTSHPQTARIRNNLALLHESQGNFREAEPLYNTSYGHIAANLGANHPNAIAMQNNLAFLYLLMEDYETAAAMLEDLVERWRIALGPDHQDALKSRNLLGRAYQHLGRFNQAESQLLQALQARVAVLGERHMDTIRSRIDVGALFIDQARLDDAERELRLALQLAEAELGVQHPYTFEALHALARLMEVRGDLSQAADLREMGLARRSTFLDRMLWVTGENAREGYIRVHRPELDAYLALLTRLDDPQRGKRAITASLQRKGLLLKITSEIEQIAQLSRDPRLTAISTALESARRDLAALTLSGPTPETQGRHAEALYKLELRVNELQGELGRASVRYRTSIAEVDVQALERALADDSSLVDFMTYRDGSEEKLLAGIMSKQNGSVSYDLVVFPDRTAIDQAVIDYRTVIQDDLADEDEMLEFAQRAYELIWAPVRDATGEMEYVYLVPDGMLNILPFNALMNDEEEYLIQTTDVHVLTSGRDLLPTDYDMAQGEYVILAGPDYDSDQTVTAEELAAAAGRRSTRMKLGIRGAGGGLRGLSFAPLPGAEEEGRIITDRVAANETASAVYFGEQAQEQVLASMKGTPEILHMATHGFFLEADDNLRKRLLKMQRSTEIQVPPPGDNPLLRAGLAFAGINNNAQFLGDIDTVNDGVLTALEVLGLDLSGTRLVVLSACETGLGEIHEGEGVYGLRRSFQEAGVAEVVSSLWEVSDAGTQALMTDFYDRILEGTPAREALRDTQLAMIDSPEWGYPYIWSAFMIVGSYESAGISLQ